MITYFVVQSFERGKRGNISTDLPVQCQTRGQAERMAERLSGHKAAVVAFSRRGDVATGEYEDAVILATYGDMPELADEMARAS